MSFAIAAIHINGQRTRNTNQTSGVISWLPNNKYYKVEVKTLNPESNYINKSTPVALNELGG